MILWGSSLSSSRHARFSSGKVVTRGPMYMYVTCCYHLLATLGEKSSDDDIRVCVESADDVDSQRSAGGGVRVTKKQPIFFTHFLTP